MNNNLKIVVIISVLFLSLFLPPLNAEQGQLALLINPEVTVSMDFKDADLKDILKILSIQSGLNFVAARGLEDRKITLYLDKVSLKDSLDKIFKANNLTYELDKDSHIFIVKDWGVPQREIITKVFYLKYATVSSSSLKEEMKNYIPTTEEGGGTSGGSTGGKWQIVDDTGITKVIKKLLSENGSVIEDFRTNSLIVTDIPSNMPRIAQVIASLDVPQPQVLLEVEMLDVSKNTLDKMGIKFSQTPFKVTLKGTSISTGFPFHSWGKTFLTGDEKGTLGINNDTTFSAQLDFLRTQTDTKYLARPRILTLNNETAEIRIATSEAIGIKTSTTAAEGTGTTTAEAERSDTGVVLRVTPQVNLETGEITMFIYPKVAEAVQGTSFTVDNKSYQYKDPEERSTKSVVRVKDGETVVIGGLIRNEYTNIETKLPILGDLPLIGALFRHKGGGDNDSPKNKQRELLVFITPRIIKDSSTKLAQIEKVKFPEREQKSDSAVQRQAIINTYLNNFEEKKK